MTPDEVKHHFKKFFGYELPQTQINVFSPEFIDFCLYISNHNQMGFEEWYEKISKWSEGTALDMSFSMKRHLASHLEEWQNSRPTLRAPVQSEQSGLDREQARIECNKCGAPLDVTVDAAYRCWSCGYEGVANLQDEDDE